MPAVLIREDLGAAARAFETALGTRPEATAAPGWRSTPEALAVQEECGYRYASDVRGVAPFRPLTAAGPLKTLQVPTTMPTMDELLGAVRNVPAVLRGALRPGLNVFTLHAEVEGGPLLEAFRDFLRHAARTIETVRLDEAAATAAAGRVPTCPVGRSRVAGRSGWVAVQGETCTTGE